jgi:chloramphenicol-sensitive protein RarD
VLGNQLLGVSYIYAIATHQVLQSSLGYFLAPVVNVLLGVLILGDRLRPGQLVAVGLAFIGTLFMCPALQGVPWIALAIATTFGAYALIRKCLPVDGLTGLLVETTALAVPAAIVLVSAGGTDALSLGAGTATTLLLVGSGAITPAPLLAYTGAAQRLQLSTLGVMQYLSPTIQFVLAIFVFSERIYGQQLVSFVLIWAGVILYCLESVREMLSGRPNVTAVQKMHSEGADHGGPPKTDFVTSAKAPSAVQAQAFETRLGGIEMK